MIKPIYENYAKRVINKKIKFRKIPTNKMRSKVEETLTKWGYDTNGDPLPKEGD